MKIKKKVALSGLLLCCAITAKAQVCITPQVEQRARELVSQMTLEEKIDYISGPKSFYIRAVHLLLQGHPAVRKAGLFKQGLFSLPLGCPEGHDNPVGYLTIKLTPGSHYNNKNLRNLIRLFAN